jgi:hypothetical protein
VGGNWQEVRKEDSMGRKKTQSLVRNKEKAVVKESELGV